MPQQAPDFKFNPCALDRIFIHLSPVIKELELNKYGLKYLFCDPVLFCFHPNGKYFLAHRSIEKTCAEIERYSSRDAKKYAEYIDFWQQIMHAIAPVFNAPPQSVIDIAFNYNFKQLKDLFSVLGSPRQTLNLMFLSNIMSG